MFDDFYCPLDERDVLDYVNLRHMHFVLCRRHKLKHFYYGGAGHVYPTDTGVDLKYWDRLEEELWDFEEVEFPLKKITAWH